ncbi:tripartite tricarboxylate transporter substrate binding protein [Verticiella sediminum]|uniref:Tripartite tricarboxylate transporter substrate binding protein n=1 Tax=Verticiella sediminum TaxID=1247510 RepID=A0A556AUX0_9BURK|nr:tripartite tricarboxylate transporter substrate binding protein [Verticiella sediminum]TSH96743.1 tripartite tricarboxylate transporter substrate binding protein [Verticiella sediminum]
MNKRSFLKAVGAVLAGPAVLAAPRVLRANRPIRVIVPLPAGSSNDFVARAITVLVSQTLGQPIIVENREGANGTIGTMELLRAAPDGHTLMCGSLSPLAANVAFIKNLPYDPATDMTPIAGASLTNHVLMVRQDSPVQTFQDFLAHAKAHPGKLNVGASTSIVQLQIATINAMAGVSLVNIPYRGTPATLNDVIGGVLDATFTDPGNALAQVRGGNLKALAVTSLERNPTTPEWPAISETLPGFDFPSWNAFVGPKGLQADFVQRFSQAVQEALNDAELAAKMAQSGTTALHLNPDELRDFTAAEIAKYVTLARAANIEPQ